jgi:hypothetical protein
LFVTVKLYGTLRRLSQPGTPGLWQGEVPPHTRIDDLIHLIGSSPAEVAGACINKEVCSLEAEIPPGAEVLLVTHVGGG